MNSTLSSAGAAAGLALLVAAYLLSGCGRSKPPARFGTQAVVRGNLVQRVSASGTLGAVVSVDVGSQVSGRISRIAVDFNSTVTAGQLIAEIDPVVYEAVLRQAEGELAGASANLMLKRQNLERKRVLVPLKAASQFDLDQATAEVLQAEAAVTIRQAVVDSARANLGFCRITSPVDGIVVSRKVDLGQTVIAAMATPVLFTIANDIRRMNISATVSEADIGQVKEGQAVEFTTDAFPEETFPGTVTQVRRAPTIVQNVVTYEVLIGVGNPDQKLFPGMTAEVSILVAERRNILKVPNAVLRYTPPEGIALDPLPEGAMKPGGRLAYVPGSTPGSLRAVVLRTGVGDGVETEVVDGIPEGAWVVTSTVFFEKPSSGFAPEPPPRPPE